MVATLNGDDSLPTGFVVAVLWRGLVELWHSANLLLKSCKTVFTVLRIRKQAALPTDGRYVTCYFGRI